MGVSKNRGTSKSSIFMGFSIINPYKPSILGYHYFWKHPYRGIFGKHLGVVAMVGPERSLSPEACHPSLSWNRCIKDSKNSSPPKLVSLKSRVTFFLTS